MKKYEKIETVFERDTMGTKKLKYGCYRNSAVKYTAGNEWQWTEKIDGTNVRVHWDGHKVSFGGRTDNASLPVPLMERLYELFCNNTAEELFEQLFGEKEVILFGEGYGKKIQAVGSKYIPDGVDFILFDVCVNDTYLDRNEVENIALAFRISVVPVVLVGTINDAINYVMTKPNSTIGTAPMEGLVGRPAVELKDKNGKRLIVKVKVCDFTE